MTYIKANVNDETHRELRLKAADENTSIEDAAASILEEWSNTNE